MRFVQAQSLSPAEREILMAQGSDLPGMEPLDLVWRPKERQLTLYDGEQPISSCGLLHLSISVNEELWQVGGIGGVITAPAQRGRGFGKQVVAEAIRILEQQWHQDAIMLFCRQQLVPFYTQFDFRCLDAPVTILQPAGPTPCPVPVMVRECGERPWPAGPINIDSLPW